MVSRSPLTPPDAVAAHAFAHAAGARTTEAAARDKEVPAARGGS